MTIDARRSCRRCSIRPAAAHRTRGARSGLVALAAAAPGSRRDRLRADHFEPDSRLRYRRRRYDRHADVTITGLQPGESVLAIDVRPATGQLYALGSTSRLYIIDVVTGAARQVGTGTFARACSAASFGFDFNPTVDRIRVVSDTEQNLRLNPDTGAVVAADTNLTHDRRHRRRRPIPTTSPARRRRRSTASTRRAISSSCRAASTARPSPNGGAITVDRRARRRHLGRTSASTSPPTMASPTPSLTVAGISGLYRINLAPAPQPLVGHDRHAAPRSAALPCCRAR